MNMRDTLRKIYNHVSRILGIRFLYESFIQPLNTDADTYRKEYVLNTILLGILGVLLLLGISITWSALFPRGEYSGIPIGLFIGLIIYFGGLLVLSRKGYWFISSCCLVFSLFFVTLSAVYQWSFILPMIILSSVLIIVISGILFSSRFGLIMTALVTASITTITHLQINGHIPLNLYWQKDPISTQDVLEMGVIFFAVYGISWLSNRETKRSLKRAQSSEQALTIERNMLEQRVEERTQDFKNLQAQKISELEHLASFGDRSSGIFHDLMTPLTSIIALVEEIPDEHTQATSIKPHIEKAIRASKKIGEQLALIRKEVKVESCDSFIPTNEIRDAIDILGYRARKMNVRCEITQSDTNTFSGNSIAFHRMVTNLISNAIDSYASTIRENNRVVTISCAQKETQLTLTVSDFGSGISEENQPKIFSPFFTTKSGHGLGIGLSNTKQNIEQYFGGTISFTTSTSGTTFTVVLPIHT